MEIKVLIVEDNPITSQDLKEIIEEQGMVVTGAVKNEKEAIHSCIIEKPDIVLVDINLKDDDDGVDLVKNLPKYIPVIYLTANSDKETVERALATHPSAFLTKPYDDKDVIIAIELAFANHCTRIMENVPFQEMTFVFLKAGNRFEKVKINDINYLQADGSYTRFITSTKEYTLSCNLNATTEKLNNQSLLRIHRSYVININNITGMDNDYVFFGEINLPISRSYKDDVNKVLLRL